jgi:GNAT superfamily N-acetyltransferase
VRTGLRWNSENGVVCSRLEGDPAEVVAWMRGAPAQWLLADPTDLHEALVAAGCRPERTAVVMGAPLAALALGEPDGEDADPGEYVVVADAVGFTENRERQAALLRTLGAPLRLSLARRDGRAVAIASTFTHAGMALVIDLAVLPEHRRGGVGRALLAHTLTRAGDPAHVVLGPTPESIGFYRRLGFELRDALRDRCYYLPA